MVIVGDEVPTLDGDPARLAQLVENLLSNAIKFSKDGGRVEVRTYADSGHVLLEISDRGIGIPAIHQPRIFERFFRSSNAVEQAIQGTGLGLSIAKMIAEAHGGVITYESDEAEGTTFRVELPYAADGAERQAEHAEVS